MSRLAPVRPVTAVIKIKHAGLNLTGPTNGGAAINGPRQGRIDLQASSNKLDQQPDPWYIGLERINYEIRKKQFCSNF